MWRGEGVITSGVTFKRLHRAIPLWEPQQSLGASHAGISGRDLTSIAQLQSFKLSSLR
jgi:hypothetical protein